MNLTTLLDLLGALLVIAALAAFVGTFTIAGGLGVAGVGLLALSWLIDRRAAGRGKEPR
ncbi:hypothetical protein [Microbacterium sp.]|uniref:hypothetical protein n=1 Tax=Microbacterium sp. TaxID=51671 RepID=UPI002810E14A|nr:hypothetical protein [Microbacterium sp.]